jgi:chromosome segregation ATPase
MTISSSDNVETREVYLRIDELESLETAVEEAKEAVEEAEEAVEEAEQDCENAEDDAEREEADERFDNANATLEEAQGELTSAEADFDKDAQEELELLRKLWEYSDRDWMHGVTLIHEDNFAAYIQEFYEDTASRELDALPGCIRNNIDWEAVAEDAESGYTVIEWDGSTFYTT